MVIESQSLESIQLLDNVFTQQQQAFNKNRNPSYRERIEWLTALENLLVTNQSLIIEALVEDFGSHSSFLTRMVEVMPVVLRVRYNKKHLAHWMKPVSRYVNRMLFGLAKNTVFYQPLGVIGNISSWNFPIDIPCSALADILAAGNRCIIKPSEHSPHASHLLASLIHQSFPEDLVAVVNGGAELAEAFTRKPWDHLVFTGSTAIGKKVYQAASENLTPVTLELGGKSPVIFAEDNLTLKSVTDMIAGKMMKSGQVCLAPDYVFVQESQQETFLQLAQTAMARMYPRQVGGKDTTSIINHEQFNRLLHYLEDVREKGGVLQTLAPSGEAPDPQLRQIPLTLVLNPTEEMAVMKNEIFGPILPVKTYHHLDEALDYINRKPRPLALYLFTHSRAIIDCVLMETISGGVSVNAVCLHGVQASLPFGGVGSSGIGQYHGWDGFMNFSKAKGVFKQAPMDGMSLFYPPYGVLLEQALKFFIGKKGSGVLTRLPSSAEKKKL